jgi:hypothetical protein
MHDVIQLETQQTHVNPVFNTLVHDGWLLRFSRGYSLSTDSVWPLRQGEIGLAAKVAYCEEQFQLQRQSSTFRLTSLGYHQSIDAYLRDSGYRIAESGVVLTRALSRAPTTALKTLPLTRWLDLCYRLNPEDVSGQRLLQEQLLSQISRPMVLRWAMGGRYKAALTCTSTTYGSYPIGAVAVTASVC